MKKIDKYILKNFVKAIFISLIAFLLISVITQVSRAVSYVMDGKMPVSIALQWLFSEVPQTAVMMVPLATVLGGLLTINKMSKNLEIIALKTSGISFLRIVAYPLVFSFFMSFGVIYFNDKVSTKNNKLKREIKFKYRYNITPGQIGTNIYRKGFEDYLYYIRVVNGEEDSINDMTVVLMNETFDTIEYIYTAKKAKYDRKNKMWTAEGVWINNVTKNKEKYYKKYDLRFFSETPEDLLKDKFFEKEATIKELREAAVYLQRSGQDVNKILIEYHYRWSYPFSVFVMSIIGLSLGSRYVRGASAISIAVSVILGYAYYVIQSMLQAASVGGTITPFLGAWLPNIIYLAGGIVTMRRAEF
jgi:lipopolysaccharide export system permease protein